MKFLVLTIFGIALVFAQKSDLLDSFADGSNQFTADVYKEFSKSHSGSFLVCPLSVDMVLALFHAGARGKTAQELSAALHLPESSEKTQEIFANLSPLLQNSDNYTLTNANKVYVKDTFKISDQFKKTAVDVFDAEIQNLDFEKKAQAAAEINKWVEEKTHDKIKNLVKADDFNDDPVAVLINAMYFRGTWVKEFHDFATQKEPFHQNNKNQVEIDMMEMADFFNYYESAELNAKFLEMPYAGEDIGMTFVLPNEIEGLSALEARLGDVFAAPEYSHGPVHLKIPKFKVETTIQFKPILQALGVVEAFENTADFSGIGANEENLKISKIIQKTFIEVEEKGTTAAAATAGFPVPVSADYKAPLVPDFIANHPFLYYIKINGIIVFVGRFTADTQV